MRAGVNQSEVYSLKSEHLRVRSPEALEQGELRSRPQHRPRAGALRKALGSRCRQGVWQTLKAEKKKSHKQSKSSGNGEK